jgi:CDP-diacylglycerol--serine O-phosphatidyltransferase
MKRHFSMLRDFHLADWFTLANAFCGVGAIFAALRFLQDGRDADLLRGMALLPLAFLFDALDGRIARWRHKSSPLGRELDSLADVISFGVAPAALAYACGMQGGWDWIVLSYFVCCGVSRLARYNVTAESLAGDDGKVRLLRGHADPDQPAAGGRARARDLERPHRRLAVVRIDPPARLAIAPAGPDVRGVGLADDQQDHPHPEALIGRRGCREPPGLARALAARRRSPGRDRRRHGAASAARGMIAVRAG